MISVILTKHKRTHLFEKQLQRVKSQSVKPTEIIVVDNTQQNLGVWSRFSTAIHAKNEFVCVIDDDTIPGTLWLEHCFNQFNRREGLYGTHGWIFNSNKQWKGNYKRIGWPSQNEETIEVDYVSHNWFFKKDWLKWYWNYIPEPRFFNCGEDMNFSFQLQKQGIQTFVPPHPKNNKSLWGSVEEKHGLDENSLWESNRDNFRQSMFDFFDDQIQRGWKLINEPTLM